MSEPQAKHDSEQTWTLSVAADEELVALVRSLVRQPGNSGLYRGLDVHTAQSALVGGVLDGVVASLVVSATEPNADGGQRPPVGVVQLFALNLMHGTAQLGVIMDERVHGVGWPMAAVVSAIGTFFDMYPLRRIYFETQYRSSHVVEMLQRVTDGHVTLPQHEYYVGQYWDVCIAWLNREGVPSLMARAFAPPPLSTDLPSDLERFDLMLQERFGIDPAPASASDVPTPLSERGVDSLAMLELGLFVEEIIGREIPEEALHERLTSADLFDWIQAGALGHNRQVSIEGRA